MIGNPLNRPRKPDWRGPIAAALAPVALFASLAVLSLAGFRFHPPADHVQAVVATLLAAGLAWVALSPGARIARASAGLYLDSPRVRRSAEWLLPLALGAMLLLLWLGVHLPSVEEEGPPVILLREDSGPRSTPLSLGPVLRVDWPGGRPEAIAADVADWTRAPDRESGTEQRVFVANSPDRSRLSWLVIGRSRWPLRWPRSFWPVASGTESRLLARGLAVVAAEVDSPSWDVREVWIEPAPGDAYPFDQAPEALLRYDGVGVKPLTDQAAALAERSLQLYQWAATPFVPRVVPGSTTPAPDPTAFGVLAKTPDVPPGPAGSLASILRQEEVMTARTDGDALRWRMTHPGGTPDLMGESGQVQGAALLDGMARLWKSRAYAAPSGFVVPADAPWRTPTPAWGLPAERFVPPPSTMDSPLGFPSNLPLAAITATLFAALAFRWLGASPTGGSGRKESAHG